MSDLWLSHLTLLHFRSHQRATLELDGRPVAIYGPNGAGKTNLLEAVSLFSPGRGLRYAAAQVMARQPENLGWTLSAEVQRSGMGHELRTWSQEGAARQVRINGKAAPQRSLADLVQVVWLVPVMDRLFIEGAEGRRRFLDRLTLSFSPDHGEDVVAYDKAMRERNRLLKEQVSDPVWYGVYEAQMAESGARITRNRRAMLARLSEAQGAARTAFPAADLRLVGEGADVEDALREAFGRERARDMAAGRSLTGPHRCDLEAIYAAKGQAARDCSTGEQKALLISLVLAHARALQNTTGCAPLLLLDEVAAHLDTTRRAALYDELCASGAQAWMTATGPEMYAELGDRAQYVVLSAQGTVSHG